MQISSGRQGGGHMFLQGVGRQHYDRRPQPPLPAFERANGARRGQTLSVRMQTSNASAYFNVLPRGGDGTALEGAANVVDWRGVLPANGDYVVRVYLMRNAARRDEHANYTLTVGVR